MEKKLTENRDNLSDVAETRNMIAGLESYTKSEADNVSNSRKISIAKNDKHVNDFIKKSLSGEILGKKLLLGKIGGKLAIRISSETGLNLRGYNLELRPGEIRHAFKSHGDAKTESPRGQQAITIEDIANFSKIVSEFDAVLVSRDNSLQFVKDIHGRTTAVTIYTAGKKALALSTMYKSVKSGGSDTASNAQKNPEQNVRNDRVTTSANNNITKSNLKSKKKDKNLSNPPAEGLAGTPRFEAGGATRTGNGGLRQ